MYKDQHNYQLIYNAHFWYIVLSMHFKIDSAWSFPQVRDKIFVYVDVWVYINTSTSAPVVLSTGKVFHANGLEKFCCMGLINYFYFIIIGVIKPFTFVF